MRATASLLTLLCLAATRASAGEPFTLADGDRVVLIGSTLVEREQRYGYWETALTVRFAAKNVVFRNLGWSGDTVFGHARAGFGSVADGFRQLKEHVLALKPTVIVVGYGTNEAFEGAAGLPKFVDGLNVLLEALAPAKARVVLLAPPRQEDLGRPLPDPTGQNKNLSLYRDALRKVAGQRGYSFVDLYDLLGGATKKVPLTDNGIHLTAYGYWKSAAALERGLGLEAPCWRVAVVAPAPVPLAAEGAKVGTAPCFRITSAALPLPPAPVDAPPGLREDVGRVLTVRGLAPGKYELRGEGKAIVAARSDEWAAGVQLTRGPDFDQAERLREAIVAKNRLYFYRWRPQNETYLFGFRKHEQGQNAREIPLFDPLVDKAEAEINRLKKPRTHTYELVRVKEEK